MLREVNHWLGRTIRYWTLGRLLLRTDMTYLLTACRTLVLLINLSFTRTCLFWYFGLKVDRHSSTWAFYSFSLNWHEQSHYLTTYISLILYETLNLIRTCLFVTEMYVDSSYKQQSFKRSNIYIILSWFPKNVRMWVMIGGVARFPVFLPLLTAYFWSNLTIREKSVKQKFLNIWECKKDYVLPWLQHVFVYFYETGHFCQPKVDKLSKKKYNV